MGIDIGVVWCLCGVKVENNKLNVLFINSLVLFNHKHLLEMLILNRNKSSIYHVKLMLNRNKSSIHHDKAV